MGDTLASAKAALASANKKFPGAQAAAAGVKPAGERGLSPVAKVAPPKKSMDQMGDVAGDLKAVQDNVKQYAQGAPKMHSGGTVPKTGVYTLEEGETVIPADKSAGRTSEYRKVYLNRKTKTTDAEPQTRQGGGNTPASGEKHGSGQKKVPYKQAQE